MKPIKPVVGITHELPKQPVSRKKVFFSIVWEELFTWFMCHKDTIAFLFAVSVWASSSALSAWLAIKPVTIFTGKLLFHTLVNGCLIFLAFLFIVITVVGFMKFLKFFKQANKKYNSLLEKVDARVKEMDSQ